MKIFILTIIAMLGISAAAAAQSAEKLSVRPGEQKVTVRSKVKIKVLPITDDSRCREGMVCVWAGNAKVRFEISIGRTAPKTLELNSNLEPKAIVFKGYQITLVSLSTKPDDFPKDAAARYTAVFSITRIKR